MGILSLAVFAPLVGALLIGFIPSEFAKAIKFTAMGTALLTLLVCLSVCGQFQAGDFHFQMVERLAWIPSLGIRYEVGIDGISLWMFVLTGILGVVCVAFSIYEERRVKAFMVLLLVLEASMLGAFVSLDLILFYTFFEAALFPMVFLIWIWGDERRNRAAIRFFLYLFGGSIFMLVGMIALARLNQQVTGVLSFSIVDIQANVANGKLWTGALMTEQLVFWSFAIAFLIKSPAFPFHTWLVDSYTQAPIGAVILGALIKTGTYGLLRFCLPLFPDALPSAAPWILSLAVIGIVYGAVVASVQTDMKRLIAFSSLSHVGFVILGIFSMSSNGVMGGVLGQFNHGIATGALLLLVGLLLVRRNVRDLREYGGLKSQMPVFAALFLISMLAGLGLPGTNAFVGEFLSLLGAFQAGFARLPGINAAFACIAAAGVIIAAVYMLVLYQKLFYGLAPNERIKRLRDLKTWEVCAAGILVIGILWGGLYPATFTRPIEASVNATRMMSMNDPNARPAWQDEHQHLAKDYSLTTDQFVETVTVAPATLNPIQTQVKPPNPPPKLPAGMPPGASSIPL